MEYFFSRQVFDKIQILRDDLSERGFYLIEGFHFNFMNTHPFAKFPHMKLKFKNSTDLILIYSVDQQGLEKVVAQY